MGLLDSFFGNADQTQALGLLGANMMAGNPAQGFVQAQGLLAGAPKRRLEMQLLESQVAETQAQAQERAQKVRQAELAAEQAARMRAGIPGLFRQPGLTGGEPQPQTEGGMPMFSRPMGAGPMQATPRQFDPVKALQDGWKLDDLPKLAAMHEAGMPEVARMVTEEGPGGAKVEQGYDKFGRKVGAGAYGYIAPVQVNQGDRSTFVKPAPGVSLPINMSLSERDSSSRGWAGLNETRRHNGVSEGNAASGTVPSGYRRTLNGGLEFIPGGPADPNAARRAAPTEDERKAAGWLSQATLAFKNMEKATAIDPSAAKPSMIESGMLPEALKNMTRSEARQQFNQGASSLSEAVLRAATGAGVNKDEALQKVAELTPQWGDKPGVIAQKREGAKMYLESLAVRSGRAMPVGGSQAPATDNDPLGIRK